MSGPAERNLKLGGGGAAQWPKTRVRTFWEFEVSRSSEMPFSRSNINWNILLQQR